MMSNSTTKSYRLYVVRHARAAWGTPGINDFDRPLDEIGRAEARDVAEQAALADLVPQVLISSPALRCRQTTSVLLSVFRAIQPVEDIALYSGNLDAYLAHVRGNATGGSLMIVGHNPMIETLAHELCRESDVLAPLATGYPTAGLLAIDLPRTLPQNLSQIGEAVTLLTPALT
jgi:phosphohistidine phosphatase